MHRGAILDTARIHRGGILDKARMHWVAILAVQGSLSRGAILGLDNISWSDVTFIVNVSPKKWNNLKFKAFITSFDLEHFEWDYFLPLKNSSFVCQINFDHAIKWIKKEFSKWAMETIIVFVTYRTYFASLKSKILINQEFCD